MRTPARLCCACLCCALLYALPAWAGDASSSSSVEVTFDRTGDGLVDAADWQVMSEADKTAYARASLLELGLTPEAAAGDGRTRLQDYLDGLRAVYGP